MPAALRSSIQTPNASPSRIRSPPERQYLERHAAPGAQPRDPLQGLDIVIVRRTDEDADLEVVPAARLFPIMEAVHKLLEAREGEGAPLARLGNQAIPADVSAGRVP